MKAKLEKLHEELQHEIATLETPSGETEFPQYGSDEEENAHEVVDFETNLSIDLRLKKSLADVESALKRLNDGTYGICKYCQKPIVEERLMARPESSSCVECKKAITQEL